MAQNKALRLGGIGSPCCCAPSECACNTGVCVQDCHGAAILGATVTVASLPSAPTVTGGCAGFCLDSLGGAGSYSVSVTKTGYTSYSGSKSFTCDGTAFVTLLQPGQGTKIEFDVTGCCPVAGSGSGVAAPLPGATVTIDGQSYTTDATGKVIVTIGKAGTYSWSASKDRFTTQTGSITVTACVALSPVITVTMVPAAGYHCAPQLSTRTAVNLVDPVPDTLHATDSRYGPVTLIYDVPTASWLGTLTVTMPSSCFCTPRAVKITYTMNSCPVGNGFTHTAIVITDHSIGCPCPCDPATNPLCLPGTNTLGPRGTIVETLSPTIPFNYTMTSTGGTCSCGSNLNYDVLHPGGYNATVTE